MARNEEKAMSMLNRWIRVQAGTGEFAVKEKRPYLSSLCETLSEAEKWRRQIMTEISKGISEIQNPGLGEFKIRDLNDHINKLVREKGHWEKRILELGGPNYFKQAPTVDADGNEIPGGKGYKYYGAARDLPGVRDLFKKETPIVKRSRAEMYRSADAAYFGYRDEDDSMLLPLEKVQEEAAVSTAVLEWTERQAAAGEVGGGGDSDSDEDGGAPAEEFVAHVAVPSQESIERAVLEQKKREMLEQYVSKEEAAAQEFAKAGAKRPRD